jgi:glyoxylase-like metal-dependent hydrolase (beta-lactamase superfamily II)
MDSTSLQIWQVRYAERVARKGYVFHDYAQYGLPDGPIPMDYSFWVIRSADAIILFDTGYDLPEYNTHDEVHVATPEEGLAKLGIRPDDVDLVIVSHFHYDHIGYLGLFERATVVAHRRERDHWFARWDAGELSGALVNPRHLAFVRKAEQQGRLHLVDAVAEVYPGITVYPVSGHSPGEILARVETAAGSFILASDAAHFYEEIELGWPFFTFSDINEMREGFAFINALAAQTGSTVIPGHDGRTRERFPAAEGDASDVAVRLA